jgi:surfeit locus 1 family protein
MMTPRATRLFIVLGAFVIAPMLVALGIWQLARLQERRALNAEVRARLDAPPFLLTGVALDHPDALNYRPITVRGAFDFDHEIVWRNQAHGESAGVRVMTPLRITGSDAAVLVDRGWLPYADSAPEARAVYHTPTGEVTLTGVLRQSEVRASPILPDDPSTPWLDDWYWMNLGRIQQQMPYPLLAMFVQQAAGDETQLPIAGYAVDLSEGPHLNYALQWFAFAAIAVAGPLAYARQQRRRVK